MTRPRKTTVCPLGGVGVGGKWKFWIWHHLLHGPKRFGQLQRLLPGASRQMLTIQLRELEQMGAIHRQVYAERSPKVEYSLTGLARSSEPMFRQFQRWAAWCCERNGLQFDDWLVSLSGRWTIWIWFHLLRGPKHFGELLRLLPQASRQVLAVQLRELERLKVVQRQVCQQEPCRVQYSLTQLGQRSGPMLRRMYVWGRWFCEQAGVEFEWPLIDGLEQQALPTPGLLGSCEDSGDRATLGQVIRNRPRS